MAKSRMLWVAVSTFEVYAVAGCIFAVTAPPMRHRLTFILLGIGIIGVALLWGARWYAMRSKSSAGQAHKLFTTRRPVPKSDLIQIYVGCAVLTLLVVAGVLAQHAPAALRDVIKVLLLALPIYLTFMAIKIIRG